MKISAGSTDHCKPRPKEKPRWAFGIWPGIPGLGTRVWSGHSCPLNLPMLQASGQEYPLHIRAALAAAAVPHLSTHANSPSTRRRHRLFAGKHRGLGLGWKCLLLQPSAEPLFGDGSLRNRTSFLRRKEPLWSAKLTACARYPTAVPLLQTMESGWKVSFAAAAGAAGTVRQRTLLCPPWYRHCVLRRLVSSVLV
jgi:hypothetical protein